jgi:DNA replication protein DnaC
MAGVERLAERVRAELWSHEDFLAACLEKEVSARQSHGGENRVAAARFPAYKTIEDFDFDHQHSVRKDVVAHLGALDFIEAKSNAVFLGPPGTGKSHLSIALGIRACLAGHRVAFAPPPSGWTASVLPMTPASCRTSSHASDGSRS